MRGFLTRFRDDEAGAVTVDWVVLTAAVVAMGGLIVLSIIEGANDMSTGTGARLGSAQVPDIVFQ